MACPEAKTKDGFEMHLGTNHLGHFLLTELLIPKMRKSAASGFNPRIVIVSSMAHQNARINWDDVNFKTPGSYNKFRAYGQSKLANVMHGAALARRLENTGVTVYTLHPGAVATDLFRHINEMLLVRLITPILKFVLKTPFNGAQTTLYCCLEEKLSVQSGKYYSDCKEKEPSRLSRSEEDQEKVVGHECGIGWFEKMNCLVVA